MPYSRKRGDPAPNPYALTKWLGERALLHWGWVYGLPVVSLRLFNVYGPRSRTSGAYGAVFGVFMSQKLHGKPFTVVGDGRQTRDFVHVADVADAFLMAARSKVRGRVFNVGAGRPQSVNRLVELLGGPVVRDLLSRIEYWRRAPVWTPRSIRKATQDWFEYLS